MTHEANCNYWTDHDEFDCTCGIAWKTRWQTEREMYRAWRKRAEEAEAVVAALRECVEELLAFVPYEKPEIGPLPNWIVEIKQRAQKCLEELK